MRESPQGVGRVVVLMLFTVLFLAAWRSDHSRGNRSDVRQAKRTGNGRDSSLVLASAVSLGDVLSTPAAARLAPAYQTNGLTFHSDRGIGEALSRAVRLHLADGADRKGPVAVRLSGIALGAHLISRGDRDPGTPSGFVGAAAVLSGSSDESIGTTAAESGLKSAGSWALDESDAFSLEATARALR